MFMFDVERLVKWRTTSSSPSSGRGRAYSARCAEGMRSSRGQSGTSEGGKIEVNRPGRLDSNSSVGGSSLYMDGGSLEGLETEGVSWISLLIPSPRTRGEG